MVRTKSIEVDAGIERLMFVSDIHGFIEPLKELDRIVAASPDRVQLVVCGDLVTNGAYPAECVEWVRVRAGEFAVMGNHDEGAVLCKEDNDRRYTAAGARRLLNACQLAYLQGLPHALDIAWRGTRIRVMHGDRTHTKRNIPGQSKPSQMLEWFADTDVDLTVVAHTHYPFVLDRDGARVANCGSAAQVLLGRKLEDGTIIPQSDDPVFKPVDSIYSTYLSVTADSGKMQVSIEHFDYDRESAVAGMVAAGHPHVEGMGSWVKTGVDTR